MKEYQEAAYKTAIYPPDNRYPYLVTGLAGEVGELSSKFAKFWRGDRAISVDAVIDELGDILWFVAVLSKELGVDLGTVAQRNLDKLSSRASRGVLKGDGDGR